VYCTGTRPSTTSEVVVVIVYTNTNINNDNYFKNFNHPFMLFNRTIIAELKIQ